MVFCFYHKLFSVLFLSHVVLCCVFITSYFVFCFYHGLFCVLSSGSGAGEGGAKKKKKKKKGLYFG